MNKESTGIWVRISLLFHSEAWGLIRSDPKGMIGMTIIGLTIGLAVLAPIVAPFNPDSMIPADRVLGPSLKHLLGTDQFGRDILSRILWGSRISLYVGLVSVSLGLTIGASLGLIAGFRRGIVDEFIMRLMDALQAIPTIILALVIITVFGTSITLVMIAVAVVFVPQFARITRAEVLSNVEKEYVLAARAIGESSTRIALFEILPNALSPLIVQSTLSYAVAVLYEAALDFLGLGVQPPTPSWGDMLNEAQPYITVSPWMAVFPGLAIMFFVLGLNLFGDSLRDALDPRLRHIKFKRF